MSSGSRAKSVRVKRINLTIDNREVSVAPGTTVLRAAAAAGIYIPKLCDYHKLEPYGACRMCIVSIEGMRGLPTSCTTQVAEGMTVTTDSDEINSVRRLICEMLIADHPADCLSCSSNQNCELQKVAAHLGVRQQRLQKTDRETLRDESNPFFVRDSAKCILCGRCVRLCHELRGVGAIDLAGRGLESRIASFTDMPLRESVCESCGECVAACPTGALAPRQELLPATREVITVCPYCGCGCGLVLGVRGGKVISVRGQENHPTSRGSLCVKGRFGLDFLGSPDRLKKPLIRKNGQLTESSWDEALDLVASRLGAIKQEHGANAIAGLASAKCTNEDNYIFQKFMRAAVGTNNVDHCARL
jgi:predicted molibdopterin-dependent oxidoreductase YjgC